MDFLTIGLSGDWKLAPMLYCKEARLQKMRLQIVPFQVS
jgi:hypothetical protein